MKTKTIFLSLLMGVLPLLAINTFAQTIDSTQNQTVVRQTREEQDKQRLSDAKDLKRDSKAAARETKARAKEANRLDDDASDAAKQARQAVRAETKAQKTRENADKQARKAAKASEKSNNN